eukprot:12938479-Prorocentrum_lima.AAC.1
MVVCEKDSYRASHGVAAGTWGCDGGSCVEAHKGGRTPQILVVSCSKLHAGRQDLGELCNKNG